MAASFSFRVDVGRIRAVQVVHDLAQIPVRCLDDQVVMVRHQHIGMQFEPKLRLCLSNVAAKLLIVTFRKEDLAPLISS